jgi:hypothetical protein
MGSDGAHFGVTAGRALATILGGKSHPTEEDCMTREEFAAWIYSAPLSLELDAKAEDSYTEASRRLAKRYLTILEQAPAISRNIAWEVFETKWPDDVDEAGGMTGFMHGWAWNAARHSVGYGPQSNPAILTIGARRPSFSRRLKRRLSRLWDFRYAWLKIDLT